MSMRYLLLQVFFVITSSAAFSQEEVYREALDSKEVRQVDAWVDESGFIISKFTKGDPVRTFKFFHPSKGLISTFMAEVFYKEEDFLGYTSDDEEMVLYFKGIVKKKKGTYFITFFKSGRQPVVTNWMTSFKPEEALMRYSFKDKLYFIHTNEKGFVRNAVSRYDRIATVNVAADTRFLTVMTEVFDNTYHRMDVHPAGVSAILKEGYRQQLSFRKLYASADSLIITIDNMGSVNEKKRAYTAVAIFDFVRENVKVAGLRSAIKSRTATVIARNRLYRMEIGADSIGLGIYEFPRLSMIKFFGYGRTDVIDIKTSNIINDKMFSRTKEVGIEEKREKPEVVRFLVYGFPSLKVAFDSTQAYFVIGAWVQSACTNCFNSENFYFFDACVDSDSMPCKQTFPVDSHETVLETNEKLKKESAIDEYFVFENSKHVFSIAASVSQNAFFVTKYPR
jgi:hypothetical protein